MNTSDLFSAMEALETELIFDELKARYLLLFNEPWREYNEKMRELEASIRLVSFHANEAAAAVKGCAYFTNETVYYAREVVQGTPSLQSVASFVELRELSPHATCQDTDVLPRQVCLEEVAVVQRY